MRTVPASPAIPPARSAGKQHGKKGSSKANRQQQQQEVSCRFEAVVIRNRRNGMDTKEYVDEVATVDGTNKMIYFLSNSGFRAKGRELASVDVLDGGSGGGGPVVVTISTKDGRIYELVGPLPASEYHGNGNTTIQTSSFEAFERKLNRLYDRYRSEQVERMSNFISSSSKKALGGGKSGGAFAGKSSGGGASRKPRGTFGRHGRQQHEQRRGRTGGVRLPFGSGGGGNRGTSSSGFDSLWKKPSWDEDDAREDSNASDDEGGGGIFNARRIGKGKLSRPEDDEENVNNHAASVGREDDDEENMEFGASSSSEEDDGGKRDVAPRPRHRRRLKKLGGVVPGSMSKRADFASDDDDDVDSILDEKPPGGAGSTRVDKAAAMDDDDDEDASVGDAAPGGEFSTTAATATPLASQRVVSPSSKTQNQKASKTIRSGDSSSIVAEASSPTGGPAGDGIVENDNKKDANQLSITSFFSRPRSNVTAAARSFDPAKNYSSRSRTPSPARRTSSSQSPTKRRQPAVVGSGAAAYAASKGGTISPARTPPPSTRRGALGSRNTRTPVKPRSEYSARLVNTAQKKKQQLKADDEWLKNSPPPKSKEAKRKEELLGRGSSKRRLANPLDVLDKKDEEEDVTILGTHHTSSYSSPARVDGAGRSLDLSPRRRHDTGSRTKKLRRSSLDDSWRTPNNSIISSGRIRTTILPRSRIGGITSSSGDFSNFNNVDSDVERGEAPTPAGPRYRGLRNLGNTCYINSSLQMIYTAKDFVASLKNSDSSSVAPMMMGGELTRSFVSVARQLEEKRETPASYMAPADPTAVKAAMDVKTDKFLGFEQRDAHEFLSDMIDHIHEELVEVAKHPDQKKEDDEATKTSSSSPNGTATTAGLIAAAKADTSTNAGDVVAGQFIKEADRKQQLPDLPTDQFRLTVQVCLQCDSCGYRRTKEEIYRHLSIDIFNGDTPDATEATSAPGSISKASVEKSLSHFFQPEKREVKCEKCSEGTHASQRLSVSSRPTFLLLHLKRFIVVEKPIPRDDENAPPLNGPPAVEYVFQKNKAPVSIAESLSLDAFSTPDSQQPPKKYHLKSIVHHHGMRASSGHYTADALRSLSDSMDSHPIDLAGEGSTNATDGGTNEKKDKQEELQTQSADPFLWVTFDDTSSCVTSLEKIQRNRNKQETAYMLLYALE